jgi:hypothetical protein
MSTRKYFLTDFLDRTQSENKAKNSNQHLNYSYTRDLMNWRKLGTYTVN